MSVSGATYKGCEPCSLSKDDGRVHFTVPNLFETSLSLTGAGKEDGWFFVHVEFLHHVGGDMTGVQGIHSHLSMQIV